MFRQSKVRQAGLILFATTLLLICRTSHGCLADGGCGANRQCTGNLPALMVGDPMRHCLALLALLLSLPLSAAQLHLELGATPRQWSSAELLGHPQARDISIEQDVAYKRPCIIARCRWRRC
jgi:hypothetical protein